MNARRFLPLAPALCALTLACSPSVTTHDATTAAGAGAGASDATAAAPLIRFTPPADWSATEGRDPDGHRVVTAKSASGCSATIDNWDSLPPSPGGVMSIASKRKLTVDGVPLEVVKTSVFAGQADEVEAVFVNDGRAYCRMVLRGCTVDETNAALERVTLSSSLKKSGGPTSSAPHPSEVVADAGTSKAGGDVDGANLHMASATVDGLELGDIACKTDGAGLGGLLGGLTIGAGFNAKKVQLDACSPKAVVETRVKWTGAGGHMTDVHAAGNDATVNQCVERALTGALSTVSWTCAATIKHGHP